MSCEQFEALITRSGHKCEICQTPSENTSWRRLHIDHDGPLWAVRGLLCGNCNIRLGINADFPGADDYLARTWWVQQCAAIGVPAGRRPEPPVGSAIKNQHGVIWIRLTGDFWDAYADRRNGDGRFSWKRLHDAYGPQNLVPLDLREAYAGDSLPRSLRYSIEHAYPSHWQEIRRIIGGIPEPAAPPVRDQGTVRRSLPWLASPESTAKALRHFLTPEECLRVAALLTADIPPA